MARRVLKRKAHCVPPELDLTSEIMDPKKVLAANKIQLPYPNAKTYNNLAEYYSHTFLQKNDRTKSVKEVPQERNYAWYYSTIGYDPSLGNEYYSIMNKHHNSKKRRRKGKKCAYTCIIPCEPMRSEKVVNLKSDYKIYCRRKFPKWFKEFSSGYKSCLDQDTRPCMSLDEFVAHIMKTTPVEDSTSTSLTKNNYELQKLTNSHRNVLLKFGKNTDPLSFLKCIIFGIVDINRPLTISINRNDKPTFELPLPLFAQSPGFVPDKSAFLCPDIRAIPENDNSAYETESSGYMSDCSEVDKSDRHLKTLHCSRGLDTTKSKNTSRVSKQNYTTVHKSVLKAKENILALGNLSEEDVPAPVIENTGVSKKQSIIVSINRKWITIRSLKVKSADSVELKENKLTVGCKCNTKISKELSYQCTCGFYKNAMREVHKFKIPRRKAINSSTTNNKMNIKC